MTIAIGTMTIAPGDEFSVQTVEMLASRHPRADEMDAYERVLGAAMAGDATLFARQDYVEEAWRIVDLILWARHPALCVRATYLGPARGRTKSRLSGGWQNPTVTG